MLRAKAYGPGEGASDAELARLQELEARRSPAVAQPVSSSAATPPSLNDPRAEGLAGEVQRKHDAGEEFTGSLSERSETKRAEHEERVEASTEPRPRRRWPLFAGVAAAVLAIGLGAGWAIWGWDSTAAALSAAHGDTLVELESKELYDPGTIVPVAEEHGVVIWRADRSDGEQICVIVTVADYSQDGCVTYEQFDDTVWPNASATVPEGQSDAGSQLVAGLIPTTTGELAPFVQVWNPSVVDWKSQYSEQELAQLEQLEAAGHPGESLNILGYDGDTAVWFTADGVELCMFVTGDDGVSEACVQGVDPTLGMNEVGDCIPTRYVMTQSEMRGPQLTVYKDVDFDYDLGDDPQFDDLFQDESSIDDKTGK